MAKKLSEVRVLWGLHGSAIFLLPHDGGFAQGIVNTVPEHARRTIGGNTKYPMAWWIDAAHAERVFLNVGLNWRSIENVHSVIRVDGHDGEPLVIAHARLRKGTQIYQWIVPECPFCGERHFHGGGETSGDPLRLLGHRLAHCLDPIGGGYHLERMAPRLAVVE